MVINVECIKEYDPPVIRITIGDYPGFDVSTAGYEALRSIIPDLPPSPCDGE